MEAGDPPDKEIIRGMGKLVGEGLKSGVFLDGAGLHRSAQRVRLRFRGGRGEAKHGPYPGEHELLASFVVIQASSMDHAVDVARRFGAVVGDGEIEIGPVVEPWDLGMIPKPPDLVGGRFLLLFKADPASESGKGPSADRKAALDRLLAELAQAGVVLRSERLAPSSRGARLASAPKGKRIWVDGPFTESKELVAGFSIVELPTREAALAWADGYAAILGDNEVDVRPLEEPSAPAA
jgi:hypothetical protein